MYPFVESIRFANGTHCDMHYHQQRFDFTRNANFPGCNKINLSEILSTPFGLDPQIIFKCRVIYGRDISEVSYEPYNLRPISKYYLVVCPNDFDYTYKLTDRTFFDNARNKLQPGEDFIYVKNGFITDTSYANLVFTDGDRFYTPALPLLKGTKRAKYLDEGIIVEDELRVRDLPRFKHFFIINAMLGMGDSPLFSCDKLLLSQFQPRL